MTTQNRQPFALHIVPSGDEEIDALRESFTQSPTTVDNYNTRRGVLLTWTHLLQRQGAEFGDYVAHFDTIRIAERRKEFEKLYPLVDQAFVMLNQVQGAVPDSLPAGADRVVGRSVVHSPGEPIPPGLNWPVYGGGADSVGSRIEAGPGKGEVAWKLPVGLAWYSRPVVDGDRVYAVSPGLRTMLFCIDRSDGHVVWKTVRPWHPDRRQYGTPGISCTPLVLPTEVVLAELGAQGRNFGERHVVRIDKGTGQVIGSHTVGQLDYRAGYAALAGDEDCLVLPLATHRLGDTPPQIAPPDHVICLERVSGEPRWELPVGPLFSESVIDEAHVYVGTQDGTFLCLNLHGRFAEKRQSHWWDKHRLRWQFNARGPVNSSAAVCGHVVYFGDNGGYVHALDTRTGACLWSTALPVEPRAFRLFSTPTVDDERVYVGSACGYLYALDRRDGAVVARYAASDWLRSRPIVAGSMVYALTLDGCLHALARDDLAVRWTVTIGTHPIMADPVIADGVLYVNSSDLYLWAIDTSSGAVRWKRSLAESVDKRGERVVADEMCCGGFFQSKPTAAEGTVFLGTPSRFVEAIDHGSGRRLWRFEMGGAVSGAPAYAEGRIYVGQQGGEEQFYCLDAATGMPLWKQSVGWVWSSAKVHEGNVLVPGCDGHFNCLDGETGAIKWRYRSTGGAHPEPAIAGGKVYFGSWDHWEYCFDIDTGALLWKFYTAGAPDSGAPCVAEGKLFLPAIGDTLFCLDAETGEKLWTFSRPLCSMNGAVAYADGRLYATRNVQGGAIPLTAAVTCLDAATGQVLWEHEGGGLTPAAVAGGKVYFASTASPYFYCVDAKGNGDGTTKCYWKVRTGDRIDESAPALYAGRAYVISADGFAYCIE